MNKTTRHRLIKKIIANQPIKTQQDLVRALNKREVWVTQATVSRDIAEIPLEKGRTALGSIYQWRGPVTQPIDKLGRTMRESTISITSSQNQIIIKTGPGQAAPVAVCLDEVMLEPVLGTIAGDDTILVIAKGKEAADRLLKRLNEMLK